MPHEQSPVTYSSYLKLDELLALQQPLSDGPEHDEMLFIVVHQVYELWFKEILHELDYLQVLLERDDVSRAQHTLTRVLRILKVLVGQLDVLETMTPLEFLTFRDRLDSASGFQSSQFRELEVLLGLADHAVVARALEGDASPGRRRLQERVGRPTLWEVLVAHLRRAGHEADTADDASVRAMLVHVYRTDPVSAELCERFVDLDEGLQEWRYRHVKMVQRTIGTRTGTGGSAGAGYLASTIRSAFPMLWAIRTEL